MTKEYSRVHRLLKILTLIQTEAGWNPRRLAEECETSERNVYRDLKMLEVAGIPCYFDRQSEGYRVQRDFFMPPVEMTLDESLALMALGEQIGGREQIPFTKPAARAIAKIRSQLPAQIQRELAELDTHIDVRLPQTAPDEGVLDIYEAVRSAIAQRMKVKVTYESLTEARRDGSGAGPSAAGSSGDAESGGAGNDAGKQAGGATGEAFLFHPYKLFFSQRAWYTVGLHEGHDSIRCLRLSRFARADLTPQTYALPEDFSLDAYFGNAWRMIRGRQRHEVKLLFSPGFGENVSETRWHKAQQEDYLDDGRVRLTFEVDGLDEIVWWVLSMGPNCTVESPPALVERVRSLAQGILDQYR